MASVRAWDRYPPTYRAREMQVLSDWIRAAESGSVVGLAGAGKSNLLRCLCHRPELPGHVPVLVDLNSLHEISLSVLYRVILRSLHEAHAQLALVDPSLPATVQSLYEQVAEKADPFVSQSALREALFAFRERGAGLTLVLDPFDEFARSAPTPILNTLRGLRDSFKMSLSYIVGLRRELAYVRSPEELGELYEILDVHVCWLGPLQGGDAEVIIRQTEKGFGKQFGPEQVRRLVDVTGGYPALLRVGSLWLARSAPAPAEETWVTALLDDPSVRRRLKEMWLGLTANEQSAIAALGEAVCAPAKTEAQAHTRIAKVAERYPEALGRLSAKGLCTETTAGWRVFSPLFAQFAANAREATTGSIRYEVESDRFFRGETEMSDLSALDCRLLHHLLAHPVRVHSIDDLIGAAWSDFCAEGVRSDTVQQAIRHLRVQIEPDPSRPRYVTTEHRRGYRFFPEGAPQT